MKTLEKIISGVEGVGKAIKSAGKSIVEGVSEIGKRTIDFCKDNYKVLGATAIISVGGYFNEGVKAGTLGISNMSSTQSGSSTYTKHIEGATESYDNGIDSLYNGGNPNTLHIYSFHPDFVPPQDKLSTDAKGINSTTDFNEELYNKGFLGTADNFLRFTMVDSSNFEWKNIFLGDANNSKNPVADIKFLVYNSGKTKFGYPYEDFQIQDLQGSQTGVYDKKKIMFFNHADLNRDKKVNIIDYTIFANEFKKDNISDPNRFGNYVGKNVNDLGAYADINRDGTVDNIDMMIFSNEWLWDVNDPNTW